jgi:hypothetical protein
MEIASSLEIICLENPSAVPISQLPIAFTVTVYNPGLG